MTDAAVSVLIRTIGRQAALTDALESLRKQTFKNFEVIVVEDGPATLTMFFASYYKDLRLHYEALGTQKGRSVAGNHAMALAKGSYLIFLDEDDEFAPLHLEKLFDKAMNGRHNIVHSCAEERRVERQAGGRIARRSPIRRWQRERFSLLRLVAYNYIPINTVLFHRSLYEKTGGFDTDLDGLEDWMLWLRCAAIEPEWGHVRSATAIYYIPFNNAQRRRVLHSFRDKVYGKMRTLQPSWSFYALRNDLNKNFGIPLFVRKLYFYFTSYVKFPI